MGGHGGLNILPQKRWNVYRRDNRLRVRRDEEQHREELQQQRQQDERLRMSNVLILLRRKKAEAQERRRQRQNATVEDAKTQLDSGELSTTNSGPPKGSSQSALVGTPVDFNGRCSTFSTVSEEVECISATPKASPCHAVVISHDVDSIFGTSTSVVGAGQFSVRSSSRAEATASSAAAGTSSVGLRCAYSVPGGTHSSGRSAEQWDDSTESFLVDHPSVVRVRLPTTACASASTMSTESSRAAGFSSATVDSGIMADDSLQCLSSAISFETGTRCSEREAEVLDQPNAALKAKRTFSSAAVNTGQPQEQRQRAKGQMQHVNFFEAEEKELHKLEIQRKKYLLQAGYTPGARSEFDQEIRTSLTQMPWYYQPPSAFSKSKPASMSHTAKFCYTGLTDQSQHVPQQGVFDPSKTALVKQRCAAASAAVLGKKDRGVEEQEQEGELCKRSRVLALKPAVQAAIQSDMSVQHVGVHTEERLEKEEKHCILVKSDEWPLSESEQNRRRTRGTTGKGESNSDLRRESRKKTRRIRKAKETRVTKQKREAGVECLQVTLLIPDEEEISVT